MHTQEDPLALVPSQEEHPTQGFRALLAGSLLTLAALSAPPVAAAPQPIHFADRNWESGSLITDLLRIIVESGYGLPTDTLPGTGITLETALANHHSRCRSLEDPERRRQSQPAPDSFPGLEIIDWCVRVFS